jgi:hypothetical protein
MTPPIPDDRLAELIANYDGSKRGQHSYDELSAQIRDILAILLLEQARREAERCPECKGEGSFPRPVWCSGGHVATFPNGCNLCERFLAQDPKERDSCPTCHGTGKRTAEPELFAPKRGACALSHDLWWCTNCKRGVGTDGPDTAHFKAGSWAFCPKCQSTVAHNAGPRTPQLSARETTMDDRELSRDTFIECASGQWVNGGQRMLLDHDLALREKVERLTKERDELQIYNDGLSVARDELCDALKDRVRERDEAIRAHGYEQTIAVQIQKDIEAEQNRNRSLWEENRRLTDALKESQAAAELAVRRVVEENERLRDALEGAPHANGCNSEYLPPYPCNCFKRALSGSPERPPVPAPPEPREIPSEEDVRDSIPAWW